MQKRKLLILWIIFSFLPYSCWEDTEIRPSSGMAASGDFGIAAARLYFEEHATDLSLLRFTEPVETKSSAFPAIEAHPEWEQAMHSGHSAVSLIEVPLHSNVVQVHVESLIREGKFTGRRWYRTQQRLVIARRNTGEIEMFVATLVPLQGTGEEADKSMESFRYLGGGNFTGRVFCSMLDGTFVKAFGYKDGRLCGRLFVTKRSALSQSGNETFHENCSAIRLQHGVPTRSGMYFFDEENYGDEDGFYFDYCPHGYAEGSCPYCLDEVVVTGCPDCGATNGCWCSRCSYCGNKEYACFCSRCPVCGKKMPECGCYLYPQPDPDAELDPEPEPEPDPLPDNGGGTVSSTPKADALYGVNSKLTLAQKKRLNQALNGFCEKCTEFKKMYDRLVELEVKMTFEINPERLAKVKGLAGYVDGKMMFYSEEYIALSYLQEEMIHAVQANDIFGQPYMEMARKNVEFEAKVIQDIVTTMVGGGFMGGMGETDQFRNDYESWLWSIYEDGMGQFIDRFMEFCGPWSGYKGTYDSNFSPETIKNYFK